MSMSDPIADMLTRIRNAQMSEKVSVAMPASQGEGGDRQSAEGRRLYRRFRGVAARTASRCWKSGSSITRAAR